jgi:hypothetical protein
VNAERAQRLGQKWTCFACAQIFYDMTKPAALCPRCGADARMAPPPVKSSAPKSKPRAKPRAKKPVKQPLAK